MTQEMKAFVSTFQQTYVVPLQRDFAQNRLSGYPWTEEIGSQALAECLSTLYVSVPNDDGFSLRYFFMGHPVSAVYLENNVNSALEHSLWELYTYLGIPNYIQHFPSYDNTKKLRNGLYQLLKFLKPFKYE